MSENGHCELQALDRLQLIDNAWLINKIQTKTTDIFLTNYMKTWWKKGRIKAYINYHEFEYHHNRIVYLSKLVHPNSPEFNTLMRWPNLNFQVSATKCKLFSFSILCHLKFEPPYILFYMRERRAYEQDNSVNLIFNAICILW